MFMEATGGQISRNEGWVIYLTTQSDQPPAGVFAEKLDYYRQVRDGTIVDPGSLGVLYEFPPEMVEAKSYMDPANFYVTNPNIGRSISPGWLADNLRKQAAKTDGSFQKFIAKHLNVQIGLSLTGGRWAGAEHWEENTIPAFTLPELFTRCEVVTVGIDGGGLDDLLGLCVMGRETATGCWLVWSHAWAHQIALERNTSEASRFIDFQRDGDLTIIPKPGADVEGVADIVEQCEESGPLDPIGGDPAGIQAIRPRDRARADRRHLAGLAAERLDQDLRAPSRRRRPEARRDPPHGLRGEQRQGGAARERGHDHEAGIREPEDRPALGALRRRGADGGRPETPVPEVSDDGRLAAFRDIRPPVIDFSA
jgi:hypothetical protein